MQIIKKKNQRLYNEKNNNEDNIILDKNDFNHYLEEYIKNNKENKIECLSFIKYGLKIYVDYDLEKVFKCDKIYLKNFYYKIIKKYY